MTTLDSYVKSVVNRYVSIGATVYDLLQIGRTKCFTHLVTIGLETIHNERTV